MKWESLAVAAGLALVTLAASAPAAAQAVGFGAGLASLPRVLDPTCGSDSRAGQVSGALADLVGSLPLRDRFGVEARLGVYQPLEGRCVRVTSGSAGAPPGLPQYPSDGGLTIASDLRLWYEPAPQLVVAVGPGWLWAPQAPYLAVSPTLRIPTGRAHFVASVDWLLGWFPHDLVVNEYLGTATVPLSSTTVHEWRSIVALRAGIELNVH